LCERGYPNVPDIRTQRFHRGTIKPDTLKLLAYITKNTPKSLHENISIDETFPPGPRKALNLKRGVQMEENLARSHPVQMRRLVELMRAALGRKGRHHLVHYGFDLHDRGVAFTEGGNIRPMYAHENVTETFEGSMLIGADGHVSQGRVVLSSVYPHV